MSQHGVVSASLCLPLPYRPQVWVCVCAMLTQETHTPPGSTTVGSRYSRQHGALLRVLAVQHCVSVVRQPHPCTHLNSMSQAGTSVTQQLATKAATQSQCWVADSPASSSSQPATCRGTRQYLTTQCLLTTCRREEAAHTGAVVCDARAVARPSGVHLMLQPQLPPLRPSHPLSTTQQLQSQHHAARLNLKAMPLQYAPSSKGRRCSACCLPGGTGVPGCSAPPPSTRLLQPPATPAPRTQAWT